MQVVIACVNDRQHQASDTKKAIDFVPGCYHLVQTKILGVKKKKKLHTWTLFTGHSLNINSLFGPLLIPYNQMFIWLCKRTMNLINVTSSRLPINWKTQIQSCQVIMDGWLNLDRNASSSIRDEDERGTKMTVEPVVSAITPLSHWASTQIASRSNFNHRK